MTIIVDKQEKRPLAFAHLPTERRHLETGDYTAEGLEDVLCIERKSVPDLVGSLTWARDRFRRELVRMGAFPFRRLVVVGSERDIETGRYRSKAPPASIVASLAVIETDYDIPVRFFASPQQAAAVIERWVWYLTRRKHQHQQQKEKP